ncbi:LIC_13387 family protein [Aliikangiella sp. IMCC44653]
MEKFLIIVGASIFGVLGIVHLLFTFFTNKFHAFNNHVTESMKGTSPVLTKETTMWDAWVGFNASHSLGAISIAAIYIPLAVFNMEVISENIYYSIFVTIISIAYLGLAYKYWFRVPFFGFAIATVCFIGSIAAKII